MLLKEIDYQVFEYGDFTLFKEMFEKYLIDNPELLKKNVFDIAHYLIHKVHPLDYLKIELACDEEEDDYILSYIQEQQSKSLYRIFDGRFINFISDLRSRLSGQSLLKNE